tara:strand:+ start:251 stop:613 length:363 start_codon:yes stop_codon:yes gene_type:complete
MTWKDEIRKERMSAEHMDRLRAMGSSSIPQFDKDANPFDEVHFAIKDLEEMVIGQIDTLMMSAQGAFMTEHGIKQTSTLDSYPEPQQTIEDAFEKIRIEVNRLLNKENDRLKQLATTIQR